MNTRVLTGGTPYFSIYGRVMSLTCSTGFGSRPRKRKSAQKDRPALYGGDAKTMMSSAGGPLTLRLRAISSPVPVMSNAPTGFRRSAQKDRPAVYGGDAKAMMSSAGEPLTLSLRAMPSPVPVMSNALTGFGPNFGCGGGSVSGSRPQSARTELSLLKS